MTNENENPNAATEMSAEEAAAAMLEATHRAQAEREAEMRELLLEHARATLGHNLGTPTPPTIERFEELRARAARVLADPDHATGLAFVIARLEVGPFMAEHVGAEAILQLVDELIEMGAQA